jgi:hypothetical protein
MPYDKETAAANGSKGGSNRWKNKDPSTIRDKGFLVKVTQSEFNTITERAALMGLSRAEFIVRATNAYKP